MATVTEEGVLAVPVEAPASEKVVEVEVAQAEEPPKLEEGEKEVEDGEGKKAGEGEQGKEEVEEKKKARKPRDRKPKSAGPQHPPYIEMIKEAILALDGKSGSSPYAIAKYMGEKHRDVLPANYRKVLAVQLRNFAAKGRLVKVKASFKLAAAEERRAAAAAATSKRRRTARAPAAAPAAKEAKKKARAKRARKAAPAPAQKQQAKPVRATGTKKANKASA